MFLNSLLNKPLIFRKQRHVCVGVGIAKKSGLIKYFICMHEEQHTEFAIPFSSLLALTNNGILVSSLRSAIVKNAYVIKTGMPVYTTQGEYVGALDDAIFTQNALSKLIISNHTYPFSRVSAVLNAILLSTLPPYPLGQRIPSPHGHKNNVVTKSALKKAIDEKKLISFTLSLPPFS